MNNITVKVSALLCAALMLWACSGSATVTTVSTGDTHTCVIDNNDILCGGQNPFGQTTIPVLANVVQVSAGLRGNVCVLTADHNGRQVSCWGDNSREQLDVPWTVDAVQIATGGRHACVLDGAIVNCWGWGYQAEQLPSQFELADIKQ